MIAVNYDPIAGVIKGFYPDTIAYVSIPEPFLEIGDEEYKTISVDANNWRVKDNVIVPYVPTESELKQPMYMAINAEYSKKIAAVGTVGIPVAKQDALVADLRDKWKVAILDVKEA